MFEYCYESLESTVRELLEAHAPWSKQLMNQYLDYAHCKRSKCSWWAGCTNYVGLHLNAQFWHKRLYHMYSDVIFGWVVWIWLSILHFVLNILILFSPSVSNLPGVVGGTAKSPPGPRESWDNKAIACKVTCSIKMCL